MKTITKNKKYVSPVKNEWYETDIPHLLADSADIEALKDFYPNLNYDGIELVDVIVTIKEPKLEISNDRAIKAAKESVIARSGYDKITWVVIGRGNGKINVRGTLKEISDTLGNPCLVNTDFIIDIINEDFFLSVNGHRTYPDNVNKICNMLFG